MLPIVSRARMKPVTLLETNPNLTPLVPEANPWGSGTAPCAILPLAVRSCVGLNPTLLFSAAPLPTVPRS